jgi:hypothetical protein
MAGRNTHLHVIVRVAQQLIRPSLYKSRQIVLGMLFEGVVKALVQVGIGSHHHRNQIHHRQMGEDRRLARGMIVETIDRAKARKG